MVAKPVEQTVRVRGNSWSRQRDERAERGGLAFQRKFLEQRAVHVGVKRRIVLQQVAAAFDSYCAGGSREFELDLHCDRHGRTNFHVLREISEARGRDAQVIRVERHVWEGEAAGAIGGGSSFEPGDRVVNCDAGIHHYAARWIHNRARNGCRLRLHSPRGEENQDTQCRCYAKWLSAIHIKSPHGPLGPVQSLGFLGSRDIQLSPTSGE